MPSPTMANICTKKSRLSYRFFSIILGIVDWLLTLSIALKRSTSDRSPPSSSYLGLGPTKLAPVLILMILLIHPKPQQLEIDESALLLRRGMSFSVRWATQGILD